MDKSFSSTWVPVTIKNLLNDRPVNGGKYNRDNIGHEVYNFLPDNGKYYGFVQTGKISLDRIGASSKDEFVDGVLVVWVSTKPSREYGACHH